MNNETWGFMVTTWSLRREVAEHSYVRSSSVIVLWIYGTMSETDRSGDCVSCELFQEKIQQILWGQCVQNGIDGQLLVNSMTSSALWGFARRSSVAASISLVKSFSLCILLLLPFVVNKAYHHSRFTPPDLPSFADLCREADDNLFDSIPNNSHHVLRHHLPPPSHASQHYSLRSSTVIQ